MFIKTINIIKKKIKTISSAKENTLIEHLEEVCVKIYGFNGKNLNFMI